VVHEPEPPVPEAEVQRLVLLTEAGDERDPVAREVRHVERGRQVERREQLSRRVEDLVAGVVQHRDARAVDVRKAAEISRIDDGDGAGLRVEDLDDAAGRRAERRLVPERDEAPARGDAGERPAHRGGERAVSTPVFGSLSRHATKFVPTAGRECSSVSCESVFAVPATVSKRPVVRSSA
jgi:hypothetical protein